VGVVDVLAHPTAGLSFLALQGSRSPEEGEIMAGTGAQDEVRKVIEETLKALNAGDAARLRSMLSERFDGAHIGTDAEEWETSKQIVDAVAAAGGADDIQAVADDVDIHILGDVAWAEGHGRFTRAGGGEWPARMTSVLIRENGQWKFVQSHASIGVPNADIFG
jgi:ketosteroid isomerase-like protein